MAVKTVTVWQILVWTYRVQKADLHERAQLVGPERGGDGWARGISTDGCAAAVRAAALGLAHVDGGGLCRAYPLHPDAEAVHSAVGRAFAAEDDFGTPWRLRQRQRQDLIALAEMGDEPASPRPPRPFPVFADRSRDRWERRTYGGQLRYIKVVSKGFEAERLPPETETYRDRRGRVRRRKVERAVSVEVMASPVDWQPTAAYVDHARAVRWAWERGVLDVGRELASVRLRDHVIVGDRMQAVAA